MREDIFRAGLYLIIAGFVVAFAAALVPLLAVALGGRPAGVSGGGCVLVMFVPICFGVGEAALPLMLVSLLAVAVLAILGLAFLRWSVARREPP